MALKPVAAEGDVSAQGGSTPYSPAVSGTWTPGTVVLSKYTKLTIGGDATVWKAECSFSFTGPDSNGVTVTGSSSVTLTAGSTKLQGGSSNVLRHGDQASDSYGNKLSVSSSRNLKSA